MDERLLTEKLIGYDTSTPEGIRLCAGFIKGWLDARDIETRQIACRDLPVTLAEVGPRRRRRPCFPRPRRRRPRAAEQFEPRLEGDRLLGGAPTT